MAEDVVVEVLGLEQFSLEEVVSREEVRHECGAIYFSRFVYSRSELGSVHEDGTEDVRTNTTTQRGDTFFTDHL